MVPVNLYAESSAVLAWLMGETRRAAAGRQLRKAERVFASDLTLVECNRVIIRAISLEEISERRAKLCQSRLMKASVSWHMLRLGADVVDRARLPFPVEPIRTLDALHIASALIAQTAFPDLALLTLDTRVRTNAKELGFRVLPK